MSSDHSPAGSNASQESSEGNMMDTSAVALERSYVQQSSDAGMAGTGPDGQSVPANEAVNEFNEFNPMSTQETMSSTLALLIHQQEIQAKRAERRAAEEAKRAAGEAKRRAEELRGLEQFFLKWLKS